MYGCTNEAHSIANLQDLIPTFALVASLSIIIAAKLGIKSCKFAIEHVSFVLASSIFAALVDMLQPNLKLGPF